MFSNVVARLAYNDLTDDIATAPHNSTGEKIWRSKFITLQV